MLEDMQRMVQHIKNVVSGLLGSPIPIAKTPKPKPKRKTKRARNKKGRFVSDNPDTSKNEAYVAVDADPYHGEDHSRIERP